MRAARTGILFLIHFLLAQSLSGQSWTVENFEVQSHGLGDYGGLWGAALVSTKWNFDPSGQSNGVMEMACDANLGLKATFGADYINVIVESDTASSFSMDVWVPSDFPTSGSLQVFGLTKANGQFRSDNVSGTTLNKGGWTTVSFDIAKQLNMSDDFDLSSGLTIGVEFIFMDSTTWAGSVYGDNVTLYGVQNPMAGFVLRSPLITVEHVQDQVSPYDAAEIIYHNKITWENLPNGGTEKYHLYASSKNPIVNNYANDVIQLSPAAGFDRGVSEFRHWLQAKDQNDQTWYYAVTAAGIDPVTREFRETEVGGSASAGPVYGKTALPHVIPLVSGFKFNPDGDLTEFIKISEQFSGSLLRTEVAEGPAAADWNSSSPDANFSMYVIMDNANLYVGAEVIDDDPDGQGEVWIGDAINLFIGFFNPQYVIEFDSQPRFQVGYAINAPTAAERVQVDGFKKNVVQKTYHDVHKKEKSYIVELKIPFSSIGPARRFIPQNGEFIPMRVMVNDNDGQSDYGGGRSLMLTHGGGDSENWNAALLPQTWRWHLISNEPDNPSRIDDPDDALPKKTGLLGNYPNPFNPETTISYTLARAEKVEINIFDLLGRQILQLVDAERSAGEHHLVWSGRDAQNRQVASGIYFVRFKAGQYHETRRMLLTK